jgi:hypothetical protein
MPLPFYFLRLVPIAGNARLPDHWMVVSAAACAVLLALAISRLAEEKHWTVNGASILVGVLILIENWPGIPLGQPPAQPAAYETLRQMPPGAVLTLPLYIGDSIIGVGDALGGTYCFPWDHLWAQVAHQKPIIGGYMGRISRRIIHQYQEDPFIQTLLDLEEKKIPPRPAEPAFGAYAVRHMGFRYVLVYRESTDPVALRYALESLPLELVAREPTVELYRIKDYQSGSAL